MMTFRSVHFVIVFLTSSSDRRVACQLTSSTMRGGGGGGGGGYGLIGDANRTSLPSQQQQHHHPSDTDRRVNNRTTSLPTFPGDANAPKEREILRGVVVRLQSFGAFVRLERFRRDGLVHISELADRRVEDVSDVVNVGEEVWVKVMSVESGKIALSMASVEQSSGVDLDPTHSRAERRRGGGGGGGGGGGRSREGPMPALYSIHRGSVARLAKFGAFVSMEGFQRDGLVHLSGLSQRRVENVEDAVDVGQSVWVKVHTVDEAAGRIGLSMKVVRCGLFLFIFMSYN